MSIEQNKELIRRLLKATNEKDAVAFDDFMTPAVAAEWKHLLDWIYATFEGHRAEITDMVAEGDQVWAKLATSGGHSGEFERLPATGKNWTNTGVWFIRVTDGKISASSGIFDVVNHIKQVGGKIVPA